MREVRWPLYAPSMSILQTSFHQQQPLIDMTASHLTMHAEFNLQHRDYRGPAHMLTVDV